MASHSAFVSMVDKGKNTSQSEILTWTCYRTIPSSISSEGAIVEKNAIHFLKYPLPLLELQIGLICILHHTIHLFLGRFGITELVSQIITGIILGPAFLGRLDFMRKYIFPHESQDLVFTAAAYVGFHIFIFLTTVKLDLGKTLRTSKLVIFSGLGNVILPLILGLGLTNIYKNKVKDDAFINEAINVAIMQSFSTFSIIANVLEELKILNSEIGRLVLSSTLVGDILGIVLLIMVTTVVQRKVERVYIDGLAVIVFIMAACLLRPILVRVIRRTPQGSPVNSTCIYIIMAIVMLAQGYFQFFHQYLNVGAAILGFAVPAGPPLGSAFVEKFETFITKVLMPVAVVQAVMRADLTLIFTRFPRFEFYLILGLLIFGSKFGVSLIASLCADIPLNDSFLYAAVMTCRGVVEISTYVMARDTKTIGEEVYAILIFSVLISSAFASIIVKCNYDPARKYAGYQTRNIMSLKPKSHLRILTCIHKPDHVTSTISLLDAFHPASDKPMDVCAVHLIQLIGRATPVLLSHQKQNRLVDHRSQNVILAFTLYQQNNWDSVSLSSFTAISKPKIMNEDISTLALDKLTSLILLPLHRQWTIHGGIKSEDKDIRTVNCKVLEKAPCSVGIFFDRGKLGRPLLSTEAPRPSLSICMIFLGGGDDREALALARRIVKDSKIRLTVLHLVPEGKVMDQSEEDEDKMIDSWALKDVIKNQNEFFSNIVYKEKIVKDGPATALELHSIVDDYDLFMLGRRHNEKSPQTVGISEWTELSELGIIGDLFASKDLHSRAAVLVVQKQKQVR